MAHPDQREGHEGRMTPIGAIIERNIVLEGADFATTEGFTQVPNFLLRSPKLSAGDKMTFAMLLSYAWHNDYWFSRSGTARKRFGD
jgi:hypothetical protein